MKCWLSVSRGGDSLAFAALVCRYGARIIGYLRGVNVRAADLGDVAQEVWRGLPAWQAGHFRGWLFRIAHNQAMSPLRSRRLETQAEAGVLDTIPSRLAQASATAEGFATTDL